jgi:hypothetical protein
MSFAGEICEKGFINNLFRGGFTHSKCLTELLQNVFDASSINCKFKITSTNIMIIDDGIGMNESKLRNMFNMYHENHKDDISMGVSGVGAKPATAILSSTDGTSNTTSTVILYTRSTNGKFLKAIVPWEKITKLHKYMGMIEISEMDENETTSFCNDRIIQNASVSGTTIIFKYNEMLHHLIETQFNDEARDIKLDERWCFIFGKNRLNITYEDTEHSYTLEMYNYFKDDRMHYYGGISTSIIYYYKDTNNNDRFLIQDYPNSDEYSEFPRAGKGYSTSLSKLPSHEKIHKWYNHGHFEVNIGMRKNKYLFNEENISESLNPFSSQHSTLCEYDSRFITMRSGNKDILKNQLAKVPIIRNGHMVTRIEIEDNKASSARADAEHSIRIIDLRCEISYNTNSSQDNPIDICMGIQANKNQHSKSIPVPLSRLLSELKQRKFIEIKRYFEEKIASYKSTLLSNISRPMTPISHTTTPIIPNNNSLFSIQNCDDNESITSTDSNSIEESNNITPSTTLATEYVLGSDLIKNIKLFLENIDENQTYSDNHFQLFNLIKNINSVVISNS